MRKLVFTTAAVLGVLALPVAAHAENRGAIFVSVNNKTVINEFPEGPVLPVAPDIKIRVRNGQNVIEVALFNPRPCGQPC